jgi:hypothetical protein
MKLTTDQLLELTQYAFIRMDGAWFLALAKKFGVQTAWEMERGRMEASIVSSG